MMNEIVLDGKTQQCSEHIQFDKINDKAKELILSFEDIIYKIAELNTIKNMNIYVYQPYSISQYEVILDKIYQYFFNDIFVSVRNHPGKMIDFYESYLEYIENGTSGKFQDCCIKLFRKTGCILDIDKDILGLCDVQFLMKYLKLKIAGCCIFSEHGKIINGKVVFRIPLPKKQFYKVILSIFYNILEENDIIEYDNMVFNVDILGKREKKIIHDFSDFSFFEQNIVNVYENLTKNCNTYKGHKFEKIKVKVKDLYSSNIYNIEMDYCINCKQYFVHYEDIESRMKRGLYPRLRYNPATRRAFGFTGTENKYSVMSLYGYSVRKTEGLNKGTRQTILDALISNKIVSKDDVLGHLEYMILMHNKSEKYISAVEKWE